jgi:hypothetical protein
VYCWIPHDKEALLQGKVSEIRTNAERCFPQLEQYMTKWINSTILDDDDFEWAKSYKLSIILKVGLEPIPK